MKEPVIDEFGDGFWVIFYRNHVFYANEKAIVSDYVSDIRLNIESSTENDNSSTESSTEKNISSIESSAESVEKKLLELLLNQPCITQQQAAIQLGYSKAWIRKIMTKLRKNGVLRREGSTKKGRWIVSKKNY